MDLIQTIINKIVNESAENIDNVIIDFCKKQGYGVIKRPEDLIEIQNRLSKEDKMIRCEVFYQNGEDDNKIAIKQLVVPFIDCISQPISRNAIKEMFNLDNWY